MQFRNASKGLVDHCEYYCLILNHNWVSTHKQPPGLRFQWCQVPRSFLENRDPSKSHGRKTGPQLPCCHSGKMEKKLRPALEENEAQKMRASIAFSSWPDQVLSYQGKKLNRPMRSWVDSVKKRPTFDARTAPAPMVCCLCHTSGPAERAEYSITISPQSDWDS